MSPTNAASFRKNKNQSHAGRQPAAGYRFAPRMWVNRLDRRLWAGVALVWTLVFATALQLPCLADDNSIDLGSIMTYSYITIGGCQFGVDAIDVTGPYGYLHFPQTYSGWLLGRTIFLSTITSAIFATFVVLALRYFQSRRMKALWLIAALLTTIPTAAITGPDAMCYLMMLLAAHYLTTRDKYGASRILDVLLYFQITLLALAKSTNLVVLGFIVFLVVVQQLMDGRYRRALWDAGCPTACFVYLWLLAGQRMTNIPAYFLGAFRITSGYNDVHVMYTLGEESIELPAVLIWMMILAAFAMQYRSWANYRELLPLRVATLGVFFVVWKHSFVRADMHTAIFWLITPAACMLSVQAHQPPVDWRWIYDRLIRDKSFGQAAPQAWRPAIFSGFILVAFCLAADALFSRSTPIARFSDFPKMCALKVDRMASNLNWLVDPSAKRASLEADLANNRRASDLPLVKQVVGSAAIDAFGSYPGILLLNGLNYRPRPCMFSMNTFNHYLLQANADYYRDDRTAPPFILANYCTDDTRLAPQDDSLALIEVLQRYEPVLSEKGYLLLTRISPSPTSRRFAIGSERQFELKEQIDLPVTSAKRLFCKVKIKYSWWGLVRSFFFKPNLMRIGLVSAKQKVIDRQFSPRRGESGFLIDPIIFNNIDLLAAYGPNITQQPVHPTERAVGIGFFTDDPADFENDVLVSFEGVE